MHFISAMTTDKANYISISFVSLTLLHDKIKGVYDQEMFARPACVNEEEIPKHKKERHTLTHESKTSTTYTTISLIRMILPNAMEATKEQMN